MTTEAKYALLFKGFKDQESETLRKVKTVFVADLELPIPEIQAILENPPATIMQDSDRNALTKMLKKLKVAGARVELIESLEDIDEGAIENKAAADEDAFAFELDLSELTGQTQRTQKTRIWELDLQEGDGTDDLIASLEIPSMVNVGLNALTQQDDCDEQDTEEQTLAADKEAPEEEPEEEHAEALTISDPIVPTAIISLETQPEPKITEPEILEPEIQLRALNEQTAATSEDNLDDMLDALETQPSHNNKAVTIAIHPDPEALEPEEEPSDDNLDLLLDALEEPQEPVIPLPEPPQEEPMQAAPPLAEATKTIVANPQAKTTEAVKKHHKQRPASKTQQKKRPKQRPKQQDPSLDTSERQRSKSPTPRDNQIAPTETAPVKSSKPRSRILEIAIPSALALAVGIGINLKTSAPPSEPKLSPQQAPQTKAVLSAVSDQSPELAPEPATLPELQIIKESSSKQLVLKADGAVALSALCDASNQGLLTCTIEGAGPEPRALTKLELAKKVKRDPWLKSFRTLPLDFKLETATNARVVTGAIKLDFEYDNRQLSRVGYIQLRAEPPEDSRTLPVEEDLKELQISDYSPDTKRRLDISIYLAREPRLDEGYSLEINESNEFTLAVKYHFEY